MLLDRDGAADLFVGTSAGPGRLLRNAHDGTFQDVTEFVGLESAARALAVQWLDYDLDGRSDLVLCTDAGEELHHALPNGRFDSVDLGFAFPVAALATSPDDSEGVDATRSEPADVGRQKSGPPRTASRRGLANGMPGLLASNSAASASAWPNAGNSNSNFVTCVDQIKNLATAACIHFPPRRRSRCFIH